MPTAVNNKKRKAVRGTVSNLVLEETIISTDAIVPECSHGRALKFKRIDVKTESAREYYACSANRDRKLCSLFFWVEDWEKKLKTGSAIIKPEVSRRDKKIKLDDSIEVDTLADNKSNAQFIFDASTISMITSVITTYLSTRPSKRVLCIGAPSIHKALLKDEMDSTLLDEDARLVNTFANTHRFNVYNGSFFHSKMAPSSDDYDIIICDPPFQPALLPALFQTIGKLFPKSFESGLFLFAFPYFNVEEVTNACPKLTMTDIRLTYKNHGKYTNGERSPVRLFSSHKVRSFMDTLASDQHVHCEKCDEFVSDLNAHCDECNKCTSIAGKIAYKHCQECKKCVKPNAEHCNSCSRCFVTRHKC